METPVLIIAAVLFVLGMLVRKYPNLIAGYNTMTAEQKKNVDVKGLSNFMCRSALRDCCAYDCVIFRNGCKVSKRKSGVSCVDNAYTNHRFNIYGGKGAAIR